MQQTKLQKQAQLRDGIQALLNELTIALTAISQLSNQLPHVPPPPTPKSPNN